MGKAGGVVSSNEERTPRGGVLGWVWGRTAPGAQSFLSGCFPGEILPLFLLGMLMVENEFHFYISVKIELCIYVYICICVYI